MSESDEVVGARPSGTGAGVGEKGLQENAIGFVDALVIGLASTAPAYSLAAVIGTVVVLVGVQAPAVLIASFVPMFFIAAAYYYMNRADPDCGTTFSWVTRGMGPSAGWMGGWCICVTGVLVIGSLADVAARYAFLLVGWDSAAESKPTVIATAVVLIALMTAICVVGTELSARTQNVMIVAQVGALLLFVVVALWKVYAGGAPEGSIEPQASWFSPFAIADREALVGGLLIGIFIYWGWESAVTVNEETTDVPPNAPGLAAVASTLILLVTYVGVAAATVAFAGTAALEEFDDDEAVLSTLATDVLGSPWDLLLVLAIVTSALAATQTTILPSSRTMLSMARSGALPAWLGAVHPRFHTPHSSTIVIGVLATVWYVGLSSVSENFLFDSLTALSLMIAFYYALTGFACGLYYRHELLKSVRNLVFIGLVPVVGGATMLSYLFVESVIQLSNPEDSYSGAVILGMGVPLVIGLGFLLLGLVLMLAWRLSGRGAAFFARRTETLPPPTAPAASGGSAVR